MSKSLATIQALSRRLDAQTAELLALRAFKAAAEARPSAEALSLSLGLNGELKLSIPNGREVALPPAKVGDFATMVLKAMAMGCRPSLASLLPAEPLAAPKAPEPVVHCHP